MANARAGADFNTIAAIGRATLNNPFNSRATRPGAIPYRYVSALNDVTNDVARRQTLDAVLQVLRSRRFGQIVGPHGTGKSTLLFDWASELAIAFPGGQWIQLTRNTEAGWWAGGRHRLDNRAAVLRLQRSVRSGGLLVIDGGEQLSWLTRRQLRKAIDAAHQYCLITTHRAVAGFATVHQTSTDPVIVRELAAGLLGSNEHPMLSNIPFESVGDVRQLWSTLYDRHQRIHRSVQA